MFIWVLNKSHNDLTYHKERGRETKEKNNKNSYDATSRLDSSKKCEDEKLSNLNKFTHHSRLHKS